ncbi:AAA family ATPase [Pseudanabaena sp. FACHB-1277]|uniref:AAA family ATPase n=1 Tax=Pseudanabaena cinerea FACHB-1277 TaxID=2949581 RepID=A0A926Z794_9CYAN|nr:AAA family ATPase [Pseudanabaena cinerea FACHB-1277]
MDWYNLQDNNSQTTPSAGTLKDNMKIGNTTVISFINLKGGVGKTTSAVNVAATLARRDFKSGDKSTKPASVLLIDLDPQSNASLTLLNKKQYEEIDRTNKTLYQLFDNEISRDDDSETFDLGDIRVTPIEGLNLDLLPSSLKLIDIQDKLVGYHRYYLSATDILFNALNKLKNPEGKAYTHIIFDCPPSLGLITLNALSLSRYFIVPTLLDAYSHWGLDKIVECVNRLKRCKASCEVELLGVLYSKVDPRSTIENYKWDIEFQKWGTEFDEWLSKNIRTGKGAIIFKSRINSADIIRKAEADNRPLIEYHPSASNLRSEQKKHQVEWEELVTEILERIEYRRK